jgi:DNA-binding Lrp family transcriptional regulator
MSPVYLLSRSQIISDSTPCERAGATVVGTAATVAPRRPPELHNPAMEPPSTPDNSTNMEAIDKAIEDYKLHEAKERITYTKIAEKWGVSRVTLARRCKGTQGSKQEQISNQQKLHPQQELELVEYLKRLTDRGLAPRKEMVRSFASQIAQEPVGEKWVKRFLSRNDSHLTFQWTTGMDSVRHKADSEDKYNLYFELLHQKMEEYKIEPRNTYNMDEKGFLIGIIGKSKRVFSKKAWEQKRVKPPGWLT